MDRLSRVPSPLACGQREGVEKGGNAPDADAAEPARCLRGDDRVRRIRDVDAVAIAFRTIAGPLRERGPGDITAAVFRCALHAKCNAWRNAARSVSGVGLRPCNDVTGRFGAGLEPATAELKIRSSTRLSYPVVDEPDSNRWPTACAAALPLSFRPLETSSPDPRHTPRQRRAHRTGFGTRTAVNRSNDVPHWPLVEEANSCATASACRPCRSIQAQRMKRLRGFPCLGPALSGCFGERDAIAINLGKIPLRTLKTKRPRVVNPRAFASASGDRGDRSPRAKISRVG